MKKLLLSSLVVTSIFTFAYTQIDVSNATFLADKGIIKQQSSVISYRLDDNITRAEAIGIALQLRGTLFPNNYQCKKYYSDTTKNDWICRAVELAADAGIVSRTNTNARPQDKITRAEAFAIIYKASGLSPTREYGTFVIQDADAASWQRDLFFKIHNTNLNIPGEKIITVDNPSQPVYFYPNRTATRAEIFAFAKNILEFRTIVSGEVSVVNIPSSNPVSANNNSISTTGMQQGQELRIENENLVFYENGKKIQQVTTDGNSSQDNRITYSSLGKIGKYYIIKKQIHRDPSGGSFVYYIFYPGVLKELSLMIEQTYGVSILIFPHSLIEVLGDRLNIRGFFVYEGDMYFPGNRVVVPTIYIPKEKINEIEIKVIKEPIKNEPNMYPNYVSYPGQFEFIFSPDTLFK